MARESRRTRPAVECLEDRLALSGARPVIGTIGDSYTDEYQPYRPDRATARNWVELLAVTGRADFGPYSVAGRGEPRNVGYATNWARSDAESPDAVADQLPGLGAQVASGRVDYAWVFIGGNDFLHYGQAVLTGPTPTTEQLLQGLDAVSARATVNFDTIVLGLLAANPDAKLVVATVPNLAGLPIFQTLRFLPTTAEAVNRVEAAVAGYNDHIRWVAGQSDRVALADLDNGVGALAAAGLSSVPYGGTNLNLTSIGDSPSNLVLADAIHVGTIGQGLIANAVIDVLRSQFGVNVRPFAPGQVVRLARYFARRAGVFA